MEAGGDLSEGELRMGRCSYGKPEFDSTTWITFRPVYSGYIKHFGGQPAAVRMVMVHISLCVHHSGVEPLNL